MATAAAATTVLVLLACAPSAWAHQENITCQSGQKPAIVDAKETLEGDPNALEARLRLADMLMEDGCFDEALHLLEAGETIFPRNDEIQRRLRTTRSMLSEQQYFEGLERAEQAAKLSRLQLRCAKLADIGACDEAIALEPDDAELIIAKGDALLQAKRPADALNTYQRAAALAPSNAAVESKITAAQSQRQSLLASCQSENGEPALQACDAALIRGAEDEFAIHKRKAILLQAADQPSRALDAYIAASMLEHDDKSVALAIVTLSDSTARKDALTLAAKGSALLTLGRAADAVAPLKQALSLAPTLQGTKAQLAKAQRQAAAEARRLAAAQAAKEQQAESGETPTSAAKRYSNTAPPTQTN